MAELLVPSSALETCVSAKETGIAELGGEYGAFFNLFYKNEKMNYIYRTKDIEKCSASPLAGSKPKLVLPKRTLPVVAEEEKPATPAPPATDHAPAAEAMPQEPPLPVQETDGALPADHPAHQWAHEGMSAEFIANYARVAPIPDRPPTGIIPEEHDNRVRDWLRGLPHELQRAFNDALMGELHRAWVSGEFFHTGDVDDVGLWVESEKRASMQVNLMTRRAPKARPLPVQAPSQDIQAEAA